MEINDDHNIVPMSAASSNSRYSSRLRSRPAFMERDIVAPSWKVFEAKRQDAMRIMKYDAGYIGYITDDDADAGGAADAVNNLFLCRRRHLLGSDVRFSTTLFFVIVGVSLLLLLLLLSGRGGASVSE